MTLIIIKNNVERSEKTKLFFMRTDSCCHYLSSPSLILLTGSRFYRNQRQLELTQKREIFDWTLFIYIYHSLPHPSKHCLYNLFYTFFLRIYFFCTVFTALFLGSFLFNFFFCNKSIDYIAISLTLCEKIFILSMFL